MQPQNLLLIYKNVKKMRFQPQKMLLNCILIFLQCSSNSTMFVRWLPYIIFKMQPQNLKKMRFQPQKMLLICILLFLQCSHNSTMFVGWLPYIIFKKIQPQNLLLIYSFWNRYSFFDLASVTPPPPPKNLDFFKNEKKMQKYKKHKKATNSKKCKNVKNTKKFLENF